MARTRAVAHPEATATLLAALIRYAKGVAPATPFEKAIAVRLDRTPNARTIAKRIVARFEALPAVQRGLALPGIADVSSLGQRVIDVGQVRRVMGGARKVAGMRKVPGSFVELPSEPAQETPTSVQISYAGTKCIKQAAGAGGSDRIAVYVAKVTHPEKQPYAVATTYIPSSGTLAPLVTGAHSKASAGPVYAAKDSSSVLLATAVLVDDNDLESQKQELSVLMSLAISFATTVAGTDSLAPVKTGIEFAAGVLQVANPAKWSEHAVQARVITSDDYAALYKQSNSVTDDIASKFISEHDPKGADYRVFFNTPSFVLNQVPVKVVVSQLVSKGSMHDLENQLADLEIDVTIGDYSDEITLAHDSNSPLPPVLTVQRKMNAGQKVHIALAVSEVDAAPASAQSAALGKCWYCANEPAQASGWGWTCLYEGACQPTSESVDISPSSDKVLDFMYDPSTGAISGSVSGKKGVPITVTGNDPSRRATITFVIN